LKRVVGMALAAIVLFPSATVAQAPKEPTCVAQFTQKQYKHYAKAVYKRPTISRKARQRLVQMRLCQHSPKARANVKRLTHKLKVQRYHRMHYWEWQRSLLSPGTKAMLARLRGCETRGIAFPSNYHWDGHHDGAYQYDGATWHQAGGTGFAYQASPAEQDVRTAWFYPSHRGQWACSA
jgi:hypothetical protein